MSYRPRLRSLSEFLQSMQHRLRSSLEERRTSMLCKEYLRQRWLNILLMILIILFVTFANVSAEIPKSPASAITLDGTVYLPTATLKPILQSHVDQQLQSKKLDFFIHPSVTELTPQNDGLAVTLSQSLFPPGGPPPVELKMLLQFSVLNPSTIQVSAQPTQGPLALFKGP